MEMKQYKITFTFDKVKGEATITSSSNKAAFMAAAQMFANCKDYDWDIREVGKPSECKTCELVKELADRKGVQNIEVAPYVPIEVKVGGKIVCGKNVGHIDGGPCRILVVYD